LPMTDSAHVIGPPFGRLPCRKRSRWYHRQHPRPQGHFIVPQKDPQPQLGLIITEGAGIPPSRVQNLYRSKLALLQMTFEAPGRSKMSPGMQYGKAGRFTEIGPESPTCASLPDPAAKLWLTLGLLQTQLVYPDQIKIHRDTATRFVTTNRPTTLPHLLPSSRITSSRKGIAG
jgi:hypothetical protein